MSLTLCVDSPSSGSGDSRVDSLVAALPRHRQTDCPAKKGVDGFVDFREKDVAYLKPLEGGRGGRGQEEARKCFGKRKMSKEDRKEKRRYPETPKDGEKQ